MVNFGPLGAEIISLVWGTPATFNGFRRHWLRYCTDVSQRRPTKLHDVWPSPRLYTYTFSGAFAPNVILPGAKFTLRPSLAFFYIGSVTA